MFGEAPAVGGGLNSPFTPAAQSIWPECELGGLGPCPSKSSSHQRLSCTVQVVSDTYSRAGAASGGLHCARRGFEHGGRHAVEPKGGRG